MTAIILIGIPASGKSSFCRERLFDSHIRISLDMLKTRHREKLLLNACTAAKQPFVIDNTNATAAERERFITPAREAGFGIIGYYFSSKVQEALERNRQRIGKARIPDKGILGIAARLQLPNLAEGFDELWYVQTDGNGGFVVEEWNDELFSGPHSQDKKQSNLRW
jgi:predicted kinase